MSQTLLKPPVPFGEFDVQDEADCIRTCALDLNCNGYYYESPWTCHTYNDASSSGGTISTPASPLSTETAFCPLECYILDCQCNETVCELNDCNLPGQAPNCTFTNCLNVSLCEAFSNSTCVLNGSNVFINCEGCLGIETTTESITITTPTPTPTNYSYTEINGKYHSNIPNLAVQNLSTFLIVSDCYFLFSFRFIWMLFKNRRHNSFSLLF